jgi:hypothetical protein
LENELLKIDSVDGAQKSPRGQGFPGDGSCSPFMEVVI